MQVRVGVGELWGRDGEGEGVRAQRGSNRRTGQCIVPNVQVMPSLEYSRRHVCNTRSVHRTVTATCTIIIIIIIIIIYLKRSVTQG